MKKVLMITTGGTIACRQTNQGLRPILTGEDLLTPTIANICQVDLCNLMQIDSTDMRYPKMYEIAQKIWENREEYDGFVVTHGTDTMAYTAAFLSWVLPDLGKPVILTGSMHPFGVPDSDAPENLTGAMVCAASDYQGVGLFDSGKLFYSREVTKGEAEKAGAFCAPNSQPDGIWHPESGLQLTCLRQAQGEGQLLPLPQKIVTLLRLTPAVTAQQVQMLGQSSQALILEAFGAGGIPAALVQTVGELCRQGVAVYLKTQCWTGGSNLHKYQVGYRALEMGVVDLGTITTENALAQALFQA